MSCILLSTLLLFLWFDEKQGSYYLKLRSIRKGYKEKTEWQWFKNEKKEPDAWHKKCYSHRLEKKREPCMSVEV